MIRVLLLNLHSTMLLLYPAQWCFLLTASSFTFHYASTLSSAPSRKQSRSLNLHSTMLLLYPTSTSIFPMAAVRFTFHYASTLSRPWSRERWDHCPFTFHYASTLSLLKLDPSNTVLDLHSTMLLLYRVSKDMSINANANLHSTMLLLYPDPLPQMRLPFLIYIPLCFYFILSSPPFSITRLAHLHSTMLLLYRRCKW